MSDHDHRGDYADPGHEHGYYELNGVAEEHHRHYDLEREDASLRELLKQWESTLRELREELRGGLDRIRALEQQTPDARQAELEADQAAVVGDQGDGGEPGVDYCPDSASFRHTSEWYSGARCQVCHASGPRLRRLQAEAVDEDQDDEPTAVAECGCPKANSMIRHQRATCTDPVVARLGWYADDVPAKPPQVMCAACIQSAHTRRPDETGCQCSCHGDPS